MRKTLAGLAASALVATMALVAPSAEAGPTAPTVTSINTTPDKVVFNSTAAVPVQMTVDMDEPVNWTLNKVTFQSCIVPSGGTCTPATNTMLDFKSQEKLLPTRRLIRLGGDVPNVVNDRLNRLVRYTIILTYSSPANQTFTIGTGSRFLGFQGDTKVSIDGPATITPGRAVTITGNVTCFTRDSYTSPPVSAFGSAGVAEAEFQLEGETAWKSLGSADIVPSTGAVKYTALAVGASGNWRFSYFGNDCANALSTPFHVEASDAATAPPPKPQTQSNAPQANVASKTFNSISVNWSAPTKPGSKLIGYHWHWTSKTGQPQKEFDVVYSLDKAPKPVVFSGLFPNTRYIITVQAITDNGEGAAKALSVKTKPAP